MKKIPQKAMLLQFLKSIANIKEPSYKS